MFESLTPTTTIAQRAVNEIISYIAQGTLKPDERLPSESQISAQLNIGLSSVREALAVLEGLGVIETKHGHGRRVKGLSFAALSDPRIGPSLVDGQMLLDLYEVRVTIESSIAQLAAARATPEGLEGLRAAADDMTSAVKAGELGILEDGIFHHTLAELSDNRVFVWLDDAVQHLTRESRREGLEHRERPEQAAQEHHAIVEAIGSGVPEDAAEAVRYHLQPTKKDAEQRIRTEEPQLAEKKE